MIVKITTLLGLLIPAVIGCGNDFDCAGATGCYQGTCTRKCNINLDGKACNKEISDCKKVTQFDTYCVCKEGRSGSDCALTNPPAPGAGSSGGKVCFDGGPGKAPDGRPLFYMAYVDTEGYDPNYLEMQCRDGVCEDLPGAVSYTKSVRCVFDPEIDGDLPDFCPMCACCIYGTTKDCWESEGELLTVRTIACPGEQEQPGYLPPQTQTCFAELPGLSPDISFMSKDFPGWEDFHPDRSRRPRHPFPVTAENRQLYYMAYMPENELYGEGSRGRWIEMECYGRVCKKYPKATLYTKAIRCTITKPDLDNYCPTCDCCIPLTRTGSKYCWSDKGLLPPLYPVDCGTLNDNNNNNPNPSPAPVSTGSKVCFEGEPGNGPLGIPNFYYAQIEETPNFVEMQCRQGVCDDVPDAISYVEAGRCFAQYKPRVVEDFPKRNETAEYCPACSCCTSGSNTKCSEALKRCQPGAVSTTACPPQDQQPGYLPFQRKTCFAESPGLSPDIPGWRVYGRPDSPRHPSPVTAQNRQMYFMAYIPGNDLKGSGPDARWIEMKCDGTVCEKYPGATLYSKGIRCGNSPDTFEHCPTCNCCNPLSEGGWGYCFEDDGQLPALYPVDCGGQSTGEGEQGGQSSTGEGEQGGQSSTGEGEQGGGGGAMPMCSARACNVGKLKSNAASIEGASDPLCCDPPPDDDTEEEVSLAARVTAPSALLPLGAGAMAMLAF